jgi:UbiD family decarboxylase
MDLRSHLKKLEQSGQLARVKAEVDPELEITEIATRQMRQGGPALLFENVKGSPFSLAINTQATPQRLSMGLGLEPAELGARLARLAKAMQPPSLKALWQQRSTLARALAMRTRKLASSPVQDIVNTPGSLDPLPALKCWPKDGGRFITLPLVQTQDPTDGRNNLGMYRMQIMGPALCGMHWQIVRGAEAHASHAQSHRLPCAVSLGGDPALVLAAIFPLPEGMDELPFAGLLRGTAQPLVKTKTQGLWVPANAEFILEGYVDLKDRRMEGPFGDHMGHYSHAAPYPTFHLTALTHRRNAIYPATVVGRPPQEDRVWGEAINQFSLPLLQLMHPELSDMWAWYEAGFHNLLTASVHQRHARQGVTTALGLMGTGQLSLTKVAVLLDPGVDVRSFRALLKAGQEHFNPEHDALILPGTPQDSLDFTGPSMNLGSKLILDFTSSRHSPSAERKPSKTAFNPEALVKELGTSIKGWKSLESFLLVLKTEALSNKSKALLHKALRSKNLGGHAWVVLVSADVDLQDPVELIWGIFTRFDAATDVLFAHSRLEGACVRHSGAMGFDSTWKAGYPEPLSMPSRIIKMVDSRWKEYGFK